MKFHFRRDSGLMLPFFPTPYKDELLYSIIARYHLWSKNPSLRETKKELFGSLNFAVPLEFPYRLHSLCDHMPVGSEITPQLLIQKHTLYPMHYPFISYDRANRISRIILNPTNDKQPIYSIMGRRKSCIGNLRSFKYCNMCLNEDMEDPGEPYWHRSHQVQGINRCYKHPNYLVDTLIPTSQDVAIHPLYAIKLTDIELISCSIMPAKMELYGDLHQYMAESVHWLLNRPIDSSNIHHLRKSYFSLLKERGYISKLGGTNIIELHRAILSFFPKDFLVQLQIPAIIPTLRKSWVSRLLFGNSVSHPILHLLFMKFLEVKPQDILCCIKEGEYCQTERKPRRRINDISFGDGPWPCLNPVCDHYRDLVIKTYVRKYDYKNRSSLGTFECKCGYKYTRRLPKTVIVGRESFNSIKSSAVVVRYGHKWEKELLRLSNAGIHTQKEIAKHFNISRKTIRKQINRIKKGELRYKHQNMSSDFDNRRNYFRSSWIASMGKDKGQDSKPGIQSAECAYDWLRKHDLEWLMKYMPDDLKTANHQAVAKRIDWNNADTTISNNVESIVSDLRNRLGRPERITIGGICERIDGINNIQSRYSKLPLTRKAILASMESREDLLIRRIRWATQVLNDKRKPVFKSIIISMIGAQKKDMSKTISGIIADNVQKSVCRQDEKMNIFENNRP